MNDYLFARKDADTIIKDPVNRRDWGLHILNTSALLNIVPR